MFVYIEKKRNLNENFEEKNSRENKNQSNRTSLFLEYQCRRYGTRSNTVVVFSIIGM